MPKKNNKQSKKQNQRAKLRGKGDYSISRYPEAVTAIMDMDKRLQRMETRPTIGQALGGAAGGLIGNRGAGMQLGRQVERMLGFGDYTIKSNSLFKKDEAGQSIVPQFSNQGRTITVRVREFIGDVKAGATLSGGATTFDVKRFRINPTDPATFPWLSIVGTQFDQWEPNGIVFEFRSTSSEYNGTNQSLGSVILATQYDVADDPFVDKPTMEASDYANSVKPSECAMHGIECSPKERPTEVLYCGAAPTGYDSRLYDLGYLSIATQGCSAANVTLGELWVSYDISFYKKSKNYPIPYFKVAYNSTSAGSLFNSLTTGLSYPNPIIRNSFVPTFVNSSIQFPSNISSGTFYFIVYITGSGVNQTAPAVTNGTLTPSDISTGGVAGTVYSIQTFYLTVTASPCTIGLNASAITSFSNTVIRIFGGFSGM